MKETKLIIEAVNLHKNLADLKANPALILKADERRKRRIETFVKAMNAKRTQAEVYSA